MSEQAKPWVVVTFFVSSTIGILLVLCFGKIWYSNIPAEVMMAQQLLDGAFNKAVFYILEAVTLFVFIAEIILLAKRKIDTRKFMLLLVGPPVLAWLLSLFIFPIICSVFIERPLP